MNLSQPEAFLCESDSEKGLLTATLGIEAGTNSTEPNIVVEKWKPNQSRKSKRKAAGTTFAVRSQAGMQVDEAVEQAVVVPEVPPPARTGAGRDGEPPTKIQGT